MARQCEKCGAMIAPGGLDKCTQCQSPCCANCGDEFDEKTLYCSQECIAEGQGDDDDVF